MKKLFLIPLLVFAIMAASCEEGLPLPPKQEQNKPNKDEENKEDEENKGEEGKWDDTEDIVVNGTVLNESTTLYVVEKI